MDLNLPDAVALLQISSNMVRIFCGTFMINKLRSNYNIGSPNFMSKGNCQYNPLKLCLPFFLSFLCNCKISMHSALIHVSYTRGGIR